MRSGELRERVTIQRKAAMQDDFGAEVPTWAAVATVWAKVEMLSGREFIAQGRAEAAVTHKITIRLREDVTPDMRLVWEDQVLGIDTVLGETIMCKAIV